MPGGFPASTTAGGGQNAIVSLAVQNVVLNRLTWRGSIRNQPAVVNLNEATGSRVLKGANSAQLVLWGLDGYDAMAAVSEGIAVQDTALTSATATVTPARQMIARSYTDELRGRDPTGQINPLIVARDGLIAAEKRLIVLLHNLASSVTNIVGTTGAAYTHDTWLLQQAQLEDASVPGPYLHMMDSHHYSEWQLDLESRGGITAFRAETAEMQILRGGDFVKGVYNGITVCAHSDAPTSGGDSLDLMFGRGAVGFMEEEIAPSAAALVIMQMGPFMAEIERDSRSGKDSVVCVYRAGAVAIEVGRAVVGRGAS